MMSPSANRPQHVEWRTASPLWRVASADENDVRRRQPALLRFTRSSFMTELMRVLGTDPEALRDRVAQFETRSRPHVGWTPQAQTGCAAPPSLVLYQPAQARFYLVAASLVCRRPGLPDKGVTGPGGGVASFVLRRLPGDELDVGERGRLEYAWLAGGERRVLSVDLKCREGLGENGAVEVKLRQVFADAGPPIPPAASVRRNEGQGEWIVSDETGSRIYSIHYTGDTLEVTTGNPGWVPVPRTGTGLLVEEERRPLAALPFRLGDRARRILVGFLPVAGEQSLRLRPEPALFSAVASEQRDHPFLVARCIFEATAARPQAVPVMSEPSRAFQLADFEDPRAPLDPMRFAEPPSGSDARGTTP